MSKRQQKFRVYLLPPSKLKKVCLMLLSILCGLVWLLLEYNVTKGNTKPSSFKREGTVREEEVKFFQYYPLFSACFQSLSVTPSDRQRLIPGSPAPQAMIEQNIPSSTTLSAFRRRDVNSPKIAISPVEDEENEFEFDKVVEVRGVGVAVSHPVHELGRRARKLTGPSMMMPQKQNSARSTNLHMLTFSLF